LNHILERGEWNVAILPQAYYDLLKIILQAAVAHLYTSGKF